MPSKKKNIEILNAILKAAQSLNTKRSNKLLKDAKPLNNESNPNDLDQLFRKLARLHHPDLGGDKAAFQELNEAHKELKEQLKTPMVSATPGDDPDNAADSGNMQRFTSDMDPKEIDEKYKEMTGREPETRKMMIDGVEQDVKVYRFDSKEDADKFLKGINAKLVNDPSKQAEQSTDNAGKPSTPTPAQPRPEQADNNSQRALEDKWSKPERSRGDRMASSAESHAGATSGASSNAPTPMADAMA